MHTPSVTRSVWAISDTHLSFGNPRDQTRFGAIWIDHTERIRAAWEACIAPQDIVLLPGDLSWAHSIFNVLPDLAWLASLPGHKILARGNHDHWWKKLHQVQALLPEGISAVQGTCLAVDDLLICGTMGHIAPNDPYYETRKYGSYQRELKWLRCALQQAEAGRANGQPVLLMMHYPPFTSDGKPSGFTEVIAEHAPDVCVYGHLHFAQEWAQAVDRQAGGTRYHLVACDYLDMTPRRIWPPEEMLNA